MSELDNYYARLAINCSSCDEALHTDDTITLYQHGPGSPFYASHAGGAKGCVAAARRHLLSENEPELPAPLPVTDDDLPHDD